MRILQSTVTGQDPLRQARALFSEISQRARAHDNKAILEFDTDPETKSLLSLLPEREARQAEVHLKSARIWRAKQNQKAQGKLDAACKALDELDVVLARGILRKIDTAVLDESELGRYDEVLLAVAARGMELDEIESRLPENPPGKEEHRSRRFWRS